MPDTTNRSLHGYIFELEADIFNPIDGQFYEGHRAGSWVYHGQFDQLSIMALASHIGQQLADSNLEGFSLPKDKFEIKLDGMKLYCEFTPKHRLHGRPIMIEHPDDVLAVARS